MAGKQPTKTELVEIFQSTCKQMVEAGFDIAHVDGNFGLLMIVPEIELVETDAGTVYQHNPERTAPLDVPQNYDKPPVPEGQGNSGTKRTAVPA